jgi:hypothetical protein
VPVYGVKFIAGSKLAGNRKLKAHGFGLEVKGKFVPVLN